MENDKKVEELSLAGFTLYKKEIGKLPEDYSNQIKESGDYKRNDCQMTSKLAATKIFFQNASNKTVEGIVILENGYCFGHFWNRVFNENEHLDYDISLDIIGSDIEKNSSKTYYEYKTYTYSEMRKDNSFLKEIDDIIADYYKINPEFKDKYYQERKLLDAGNSINRTKTQTEVIIQATDCTNIKQR